MAEKLEDKEETKKQTELHPIYISVLLILVGFNFSAFVTSYDSEIHGKNFFEIFGHPGPTKGHSI